MMISRDSQNRKSYGEVRKGRSPIVEVVIHHCTWKEGSDTNTASQCVGLWWLSKHGITGNNLLKSLISRYDSLFSTYRHFVVEFVEQKFYDRFLCT